MRFNLFYIFTKHFKYKLNYEPNNNMDKAQHYFLKGNAW